MVEGKLARVEGEQTHSSVQIGASVETEVDSISFVLDSIREKGKPPVSYVLPPDFPQSIEEKALIPGVNYRAELTAWMSQSFHPEKYQSAINHIQELWGPIEPLYWDVLSKINGLKPPENIRGDVVLYGVGGGYYPDKTKFSIWTNGDQDEPRFKRVSPIHTVGHEIIELSIHPIVKSLGIPYWQKERVVDLLMTQSPLSELFPGYRQQDNGDRTIDRHFSWESAADNIQEMLSQIVASRS